MRSSGSSIDSAAPVGAEADNLVTLYVALGGGLIEGAE
jgi:hypothetical protein